MITSYLQKWIPVKVTNSHSKQVKRIPATNLQDLTNEGYGIQAYVSVCNSIGGRMDV